MKMFERIPVKIPGHTLCAALALAAILIAHSLSAADFKPSAALASNLWEYPLRGFDEADYATGVEALFQVYEESSGNKLVPGERGRAGLKIYTASGAGLATPRNLVRAVLTALEKRGFQRQDLFILSHSQQNLRESRYLSRLSREEIFEGVPVFAHTAGNIYDPDWYYESNLPSRDRLTRLQADSLMQFEVDPEERRSYLAAPLLHDVDFWINLPVAMDNEALGVSAALANATLWNISNQSRFFDSPANAPVAAAEIAAIPELRRTWAFSLISLERYQFMGGPRFNANYTHREPRLWLSANPVAIDYLMWRRIESARTAFRLPTAEDVPPLLGYARALGLGEFQPEALNLIRLPSSQ